MVRIEVDRETRRLEQRAVVFPARVADPYGCAGDESLEQVGTNAQGSRTAQRLGGTHAPVRDQCRINAKQQGLHGSVVCGQAINWEVPAGWQLRDPNPFCLAHSC